MRSPLFYSFGHDLVGFSGLLASVPQFCPGVLLSGTPVAGRLYPGVFQLPALIVLREAGVSVDLTTSRFQQTAAHVAAFAGADHCLRYLVHFGCNVNKQV